MSDYDTQIIDAGEAKFILNSPVFKRAFGMVRDSILSQMSAVKPRDKEMHSILIGRLQTLEAFEASFRKVIATGELAEKEIKHQRTLAERARALIERPFSRD